MSKFVPRVLLFLAASAVTLSASAGVDVKFTAPEHYKDIGRMGRDRDDALDDLQKIFQDLGQRYLAPNQTLRIEVLDVDLAGKDNVLRPPRSDVRVMRGMADWPMIKLRYQLQVDGATVSSGEETIADLAYQQSHLSNISNEPLYYEKQMLDKWFVDRFSPAKNKGKR